MNPRILHHMVVVVLHASIISESEVSITVLCLLSSLRYTAVQIKNFLESMSVIKVPTLKNTIVLCPLVIVWNWSIHYPAVFDSLHSSMNQELYEKHLCNKSSHHVWKIQTISRYAKEAIKCNHQINAFHC